MALAATCSRPLAGLAAQQQRRPLAFSGGAAAAVRAPQRRVAAAAASSSDASSSPNPARAFLTGVASSIYKATASFQAADPSLSPLWQGLARLDAAAVANALRSGSSPDERDTSGDTPLLMIARQGHYKYPPAEIPSLLVQAGADLEARDAAGRTALQISLLSGWQNIAELLLKSGADRSVVDAAVKGAITCPDCKRIVAVYNL